MVRLARALLVGVALAALVGACQIEPCEFVSPCPDEYDVHAWCEEHDCTSAGEPAECDGGGCLMRRNEVLSIPLGGILTQAEGRDLHVGGSYGGCLGDGSPTDSISVTIDGVPGERFQLEGQAGPTFRWDPFPENPMTLELVYGDTEELSCFNAALWLVDVQCEADNPAPTNCIPRG